MCVCISVSLSACLSACLYASLYACLYASLYACLYACLPVCHASLFLQILFLFINLLTNKNKKREFLWILRSLSATLLIYNYKLFYSIYYLASQYMIAQKLSHFSVTDLNIGYFCATHRTWNERFGSWRAQFVHAVYTELVRTTQFRGWVFVFATNVALFFFGNRLIDIDLNWQFAQVRGLSLISTVSANLSVRV
jgi:hypothetical protein